MAPASGFRVFSCPRHDPGDDLFRGFIRESEGIAVSHEPDSLTSGIVDNLTRSAVGEVVLNLTPDFSGSLAF
jgi:hypothetical protein